ncbi:hypothetical protein ES703_65509 [subsurface metagenome]
MGRKRDSIFQEEEYKAPQVTEETMKEIEAELTPRKPISPTKLMPELVQEIKDMKYKNFTIDLSVAHTREKINLRTLGIVADTLTIIRADAAFDYIMNEPTNDPTPAVAGMAEDQFEIEEIYITNAAAVAGSIAIIRVTYNPFLIRIR